VCMIAVALLAACSDSDQTAQTQVVRKKLVAQAQPAPKPTPAVQPEPAVVAQAQAPDTAKPAAPPKPKEPPPPTQTPPAPAPVQPVQAPPQAPVVAASASGPAVSLPLPAPEPRKPEGAMIVTDNQVAALLNIQAPVPYTAKDKIDPFEPLLREESAQAMVAHLNPKKRVPQSPLEKIDLAQLKLVAIVAAPTGNRALVEESTGKGYILREGTYVGLNSGKVVGIGLDKILVEEEFEDVYGKTILQKKEITLPKPPGEL